MGLERSELYLTALWYVKSAGRQELRHSILLSLLLGVLTFAGLPEDLKTFGFSDIGKIHSIPFYFHGPLLATATMQGDSGKLLLNPIAERLGVVKADIINLFGEFQPVAEVVVATKADITYVIARADSTLLLFSDWTLQDRIEGRIFLQVISPKKNWRYVIK